MILASVIGVVAGLMLLVSCRRACQPVHCPDCRTLVPRIRWPASLRQMLWGGWTCRNCRCEMDRLGRRLEADQA